jgi:hypothetical protein
VELLALGLVVGVGVVVGLVVARAVAPVVGHAWTCGGEGFEGRGSMAALTLFYA